MYAVERFGRAKPIREIFGGGYAAPEAPPCNSIIEAHPVPHRGSYD